MNAKPTTQRKTTALSSERRETDIVKLTESANRFLLADKVTGINELKAKLKSELIPKGILYIETANDSITFYELQCHPGAAAIVKFTVVVKSNLQLLLFLKNERMSTNKVSHLLSNGCIWSVSSLQNVLAHMKNVLPEQIEDITNVRNTIIDRMELFKSLAPDSAKAASMSFLQEQVELLLKEKNGRKYSSSLLACALLWMNTSPALYKQILNDGVLALPSVSRLRSLSSGLNMEPKVSTSTLNSAVKNKLVLSEKPWLIFGLVAFDLLNDKPDMETVFEH
ncbi:hypothetical protein TCAL_15225, partial [Tigriopus californicus]